MLQSKSPSHQAKLVVAQISLSRSWRTDPQGRCGPRVEAGSERARNNTAPEQLGFSDRVRNSGNVYGSQEAMLSPKDVNVALRLVARELGVDFDFH